jgi:hypothetical protein
MNFATSSRSQTLMLQLGELPRCEVLEVEYLSFVYYFLLLRVCCFLLPHHIIGLFGFGGGVGNFLRIGLLLGPKDSWMNVG